MTTPAAEPSLSSARSPRWPWTEAAGAAQAPLILGHLSSGREEQPGRGTGGESMELLNILSQTPAAISLLECCGDEPDAHPPHEQAVMGAVLNSKGAPQA